MKIAGMNVSDPVLDRIRAEKTMDQFLKSQPGIKHCGCGKSISGNRSVCLDCSTSTENAQKKIEFIEKQVQSVRTGMVDSICCPYCGGVNSEDLEYCCSKFGRALSACWERVRAEEAKERTDRVLQVVN